MKTNLSIRNVHISEEKIITDLKYIAKKISINSFSYKTYKENGGKYEYKSICRRFVSWNNALLKAGVNPINYTNYSDEELFNNLENVWITIGKQPSRRDMISEKGSKLSYSPYIRRFGTWTETLIQFVSYMNFEISSKNIDEKIENKHITTRDINIRMRFKVMQRDNFKCCACGSSPANDPSIILHVDHVIPWSKGGETLLDNLQTLCSKCNLGKSDLE